MNPVHVHVNCSLSLLHLLVHDLYNRSDCNRIHKSLYCGYTVDVHVVAKKHQKIETIRL